MMMKILGLGVVLTVAACAAPTDDDGARSVESAATTTDDVQTQLAQVRQVTDKYHDVNVAFAEGFINFNPRCESSAAGGMGYHFGLPSRLNAPPSMLEPALLLYNGDGSGGFQLVGVEYFQAVIQDGRPYFGDGRDLRPQPAPTMFGQTFNGPMPGHTPDMPWHWDLHVWVWQANPAGTFAQWNPAMNCR